MNISGNMGQHTLALFGLTAPTMADKLAALPQTVRAAAPVARAGTVVTESDAPPPGYPTEAERQAELAATAIRAAAHDTWYAGELAFEAEHGFRRQINDALRGAHSAAMGRAQGEAAFGSRAEAMAFARNAVEHIRSKVQQINRYDLSSDQERKDVLEINVQNIGMRNATMLYESRKDDREANPMWVEIENADLRRSFNMTKPVYEISGNGMGSMRAFDLSHSMYGKVLSIDEVGTVTLFGADGTAYTPETYPSDGHPSTWLDRKV